MESEVLRRKSRDERVESVERDCDEFRRRSLEGGKCGKVGRGVGAAERLRRSLRRKPPKGCRRQPAAPLPLPSPPLASL